MGLEYRRIRGIHSPSDAAVMLGRSVMLLVAGVWRRLMFRTVFIAFTGSVGKTTAKNCTAAILSSKFPIVHTRGSHNHFRGIFDHVLKVRPWHRFAVIEVGIDGPGQMKWFAKALRPDIGVWLGAARVHSREFESVEQIAQEKSRLLQSLAPGGMAILNNDDRHCAAFQPPQDVRVIRFGVSPGSNPLARNLTSAWPGRFSFDVSYGEVDEHVVTQLVGTHWAPSVLAAISVGLQCGFTLTQTLAPLSQVMPTTARLSRGPLPNGAVFLRDEFIGSVDTLEPALRVLADAKVNRRILVYSDMNDLEGRSARRALIASAAVRSADLVIFIGVQARRDGNAAVRAGMQREAVHSFDLAEQASEFLRQELRAGDLVLLRGRILDKLSRIYLAQIKDVTCWKANCIRKNLCDVCPELSRPVQISQ